MKATDRQRILDKSKLKWLKNNARIPEIQECDSSTYNSHKQTNTFNTDLGSWPAMICWKIPTQAPLFPSQYSGLGSSLSNTSNALAA